MVKKIILLAMTGLGIFAVLSETPMESVGQMMTWLSGMVGTMDNTPVN